MTVRQAVRDLEQEQMERTQAQPHSRHIYDMQSDRFSRFQYFVGY